MIVMLQFVSSAQNASCAAASAWPLHRTVQDRRTGEDLVVIERKVRAHVRFQR
jgi:hypothetical protein